MEVLDIVCKDRRVGIGRSVRIAIIRDETRNEALLSDTEQVGESYYRCGQSVRHDATLLIEGCSADEGVAQVRLFLP